MDEVLHPHYDFEGGSCHSSEVDYRAFRDESAGGRLRGFAS
jgi:hypothetical protein